MLTVQALRLAHVQLVTAAVLFGITYTARAVLVHDVHPIVLTGLIFGIFTVFWAILYRPSWRKMGIFFRRHPGRVVGASGCSLSGTVLFTLALGHLGAGVAIVLERLTPLAVLLLSAIFLKERLPRRTVPWILVALAASWGVSVKAWDTMTWDTVDGVGMGAMIGAVSLGAGGITLGRFLLKNTDLPVADFTVLRYALSTTLLVPVLVGLPSEAWTITLSPEKWALLIVVATLVSGLATNLYFQGLRRVDAPTSSFLQMPTPLVGVLIGHFALGENLSLFQGVSMIFLLVAVYRIVRLGKPKKSPPIPTEEV